MPGVQVEMGTTIPCCPAAEKHANRPTPPAPNPPCCQTHHAATTARNQSPPHTANFGGSLPQAHPAQCGDAPQAQAAHRGPGTHAAQRSGGGDPDAKSGGVNTPTLSRVAPVVLTPPQAQRGGGGGPSERHTFTK